MPASMSALAKYAVSANSTPATALEIISGDVRLMEEFVAPDGIVGSRSHRSEFVRRGLRRVSGQIELNPTPVVLDFLLPRLLGANESSDTFAVDETIPEFYFFKAFNNGKDFTYNGCVISRATIRGSQGQLLSWLFDIEGIDETEASAGSLAMPALGVTTQPFVFSDSNPSGTSTITVGGVAYPVKECEIVIDNVVDTEQFYNSLTRARIPAKDRLVTVTLRLPYGDATALYGASLAGQAVVCTFTNGNTSVSFSFAKCHFPRATPVTNGKEEIMLELSGMARKSGSTNEIVVTCDSTA